MYGVYSFVCECIIYIYIYREREREREREIVRREREKYSVIEVTFYINYYLLS